MSEWVETKLHEIAYDAADTANRAFNMLRESAMEQPALQANFLALQAMAGVVFGQEQAETCDSRVETRLRMTIPGIIKDLKVYDDLDIGGSDTLKLRVTNMLKKEGNPSLREILTAGSDRMQDIRNFGDECHKLLLRVKDAVVPNIIWHPKPDGGCAAQLYQSLDEIPAKVIDPSLKVTQMSDGRPCSVKDLPRLDDELLRKCVSKNRIGVSTDSNSIDDAAQDLRLRIYEFTKQFTNAKEVKGDSV